MKLKVQVPMSLYSVDTVPVPTGRTFPPLFTINLPEEDQIMEDLEDMEGMQTTIQVISFFVCVIVTIIILYQIFK